VTAAGRSSQSTTGYARVTAPRRLDRLFRAAGGGALLALAVTGAALLLGIDAWRAPFVLAHLLALVALVPLGIALVAAALRAGYAERGTPLAAIRATVARFPLETALVAVACTGVAITLSQFDGGLRAARTTANAVTVAVVIVLVMRYLRAASAAP
jgi:hypothetical protein